VEPPNHRHRLLLGAGSERPRNCRAAEQHHKFTPTHRLRRADDRSDIVRKRERSACFPVRGGWAIEQRQTLMDENIPLRFGLPAAALRYPHGRVSRSQAVNDGLEGIGMPELGKSARPANHPVPTFIPSRTRVRCGAKPEAADLQHELLLSADIGHSRRRYVAAGIGPKAASFSRVYGCGALVTVK
jgi:hypothetical protein